MLWSCFYFLLFFKSQIYFYMSFFYMCNMNVIALYMIAFATIYDTYAECNMIYSIHHPLGKGGALHIRDRFYKTSHYIRIHPNLNLKSVMVSEPGTLVFVNRVISVISTVLRGNHSPSRIRLGILVENGKLADTLNFPYSLIIHYLNRRPPCRSRD